MGLLDIFSKKSKPDYGKLYPDPPQYSLAPGSLSQYQGQLQSLVDLFGKRSRGEDSFDYMTYLYGPQESEINRQFGINRPQGDQTVGALQRTLEGLNQRGLLDAGTSGIVQAQLEADRIRQLAQLFGESKQLQRGDIDTSYEALASLYPTQFETAQIQPNIDFSNAQARFNQDFLRNSAQQAYEASKPASPLGGILGTAVGSLFGPVGASIGGSLFGGGGGGGLNLGSLFGGGQNNTPYVPSMPNQGNMVANSMNYTGGNNYNAIKYPSLFGSPGFSF